MNAPHHPARPLAPAAPAVPECDCRPTVVRSTLRDRDGLFRGWGPAI